MGHIANLLPLLLQVDKDVSCAAPLCAVLQRFSLLHQCLFLGQVLVQAFLQGLEELSLLLEEGIASLAETLKDGSIHLLRCKADGLPGGLHLNNLLGYLVPVGRGLQVISRDSLQLLAEGSLLVQVLLLLGLASLEEVLMTLVYGCSSRLETVPNLLTELTGHRACLLPFLIQDEHLVIGSHHLGGFYQRLSLLAQAGLGLQILAEVIVAQLMSQLQQVVELLHVKLVVLPQLRGTLSRNQLYLLPLSLQGLELVKGTVGFLRCRGQLLNAVQYLQFSLQILCLLTFQLLLCSSAAIADQLHRCTELRLQRVNLRFELLRFAATLYEGLSCFLNFCVMELVEELFQQIQFLLLTGFTALCDFLYSVHNLFLCCVYRCCRCCIHLCNLRRLLRGSSYVSL